MSEALKLPDGITPDTYNQLIMDSGVVYLDWGEASQRLLGATRGGNSISIEQEFREMMADGAPGPVLGSQRIIRVVSKLTVNLLAQTTANFIAMLPGATFSVDSGTHDKIIRDCQVKAGDHFKNITLLIKKNGTDELVAFKVLNPLALGNFEMSGADDDESVIPIEFTGHFDPADLSVQPFEIFNPLETLATTYTLTYNAGANGAIFGDAVQTVVSGDDGAAVVAVPDAGYAFVEWTDTTTTNPRTDTNVVADVTQTATFVLV